MKSKICIKDNKVGSWCFLCCCYVPIAGFFESLFTEYKPVWAIIMAPEICKFLFHWQKRTSPLRLCIRDCISPGSQREHRLRPLKMENCSLFSPTHASHSTFVLNTQHLHPPNLTRRKYTAPAFKYSAKCFKEERGKTRSASSSTGWWWDGDAQGAPR